MLSSVRTSPWDLADVTSDSPPSTVSQVFAPPETHQAHSYLLAFCFSSACKVVHTAIYCRAELSISLLFKYSLLSKTSFCYRLDFNDGILVHPDLRHNRAFLNLPKKYLLPPSCIVLALPAHVYGLSPWKRKCYESRDSSDTSHLTQNRAWLQAGA